MVYLCTDLIAAPGAVVQTTRVGTAWSKISGLQPELAYLARAQVIVGSNPTRPTIHLILGSLRSLSLKVDGRGTFAAARTIVLPRSAFIWLIDTEHEVDSRPFVVTSGARMSPT